MAFFGTDPTTTVADVLTSVADRFSLENTFRDCKAIVEAGQQQVRSIWATSGSRALWSSRPHTAPDAGLRVAQLMAFQRSRRFQASRTGVWPRGPTSAALRGRSVLPDGGC